MIKILLITLFRAQETIIKSAKDKLDKLTAQYNELSLNDVKRPKLEKKIEIPCGYSDFFCINIFHKKHHQSSNGNEK